MIGSTEDVRELPLHHTQLYFKNASAWLVDLFHPPLPGLEQYQAVSCLHLYIILNRIPYKYTWITVWDCCPSNLPFLRADNLQREETFLCLHFRSNCFTPIFLPLSSWGVDARRFPSSESNPNSNIPTQISHGFAPNLSLPPPPPSHSPIFYLENTVNLPISRTNQRTSPSYTTHRFGLLPPNLSVEGKPSRVVWPLLQLYWFANNSGWPLK